MQHKEVAIPHFAIPLGRSKWTLIMAKPEMTNCTKSPPRFNILEPHADFNELLDTYTIYRLLSSTFLAVTTPLSSRRWNFCQYSDDVIVMIVFGQRNCHL